MCQQRTDWSALPVRSRDPSELNSKARIRSVWPASLVMIAPVLAPRISTTWLVCATASQRSSGLNAVLTALLTGVNKGRPLGTSRTAANAADSWMRDLQKPEVDRTNSLRPSRLNRMERTGPSKRAEGKMSSAVSAFPTLTPPSDEAVAAYRPSGLKAPARTED